MNAMMRNLLTDRFGMRAHRETQDLPSYMLTAGKGGLKAVKIGPVVQEPGVRTVKCPKCTVEGFLEKLGNPMDRPVIDRTGLTGEYDFQLAYQPEYRSRPGMDVGGGGPLPSSLNEPLAPTLTTAIQDQLGLKLELKKMPTEVIVIDSVARTPAEN
jgi:uncharacterized protein (TIGR03435 family)